MADPDRCGPGTADDDLPGFHNCPPSDGGLEPSYYWRHPGRARPGTPQASPDRFPTISRGFNFGVILLPYTRDWGLRVGTMRRKKAYPTILHSFARAEDRAYAEYSAEHFIPKKDRYEARFIAHLIRAKSFAGYRWEGKPLMAWCYLAQLRADAIGPPKSFAPAAALDAAIRWCASDVQTYWAILTPERFPYTPLDVITYWHVARFPDLPGAIPLPPNLEPPP